VNPAKGHPVFSRFLERLRSLSLAERFRSLPLVDRLRSVPLVERLRSLPRAVTVTVAVVLLVVLVTVATFFGLRGSDDQTVLETGTPTLVTPSQSFTAPASSDGDQPPTVAVTTLAAAPLGKPVVVDNGTKVTVSDLKRLTVEANGPGETDGPAISVVVSVRNDSGESLDLDGYAVTASYGDDTPAVPSAAKPYDPLSGTLANGRSASGTYVFRVGKTDAEMITIQVSSNTAADIAVFRP
jgi:hypothetical protein